MQFNVGHDRINHVNETKFDEEKEEDMNDNENSTKSASIADVTQIDAMIAEANAKKQKRAKSDPNAPKPVKAPRAPKEIDPAVEAARAAKIAERDAARAEKLALRAAIRDQKLGERAMAKELRDAARAEKIANRPAPHAAKLEKARAKLPTLTENAGNIVESMPHNDLTAADYLGIAEHLAFRARVLQTTSAVNDGVKLSVGDTVRINTGKNAGGVGTVSQVRRIRTMVNVPGVDKPVYCFISDVTAITPEIEGNDEVSLEEMNDLLNLLKQLPAENVA